jgi:hypothetical protein
MKKPNNTIKSIVIEIKILVGKFNLNKKNIKFEKHFKL